MTQTICSFCELVRWIGILNLEPQDLPIVSRHLAQEHEIGSFKPYQVEA